MSFNYEQSIWGKGEASLKWCDPTAFRLQKALETIDEAEKAQKAANAGKAFKVMELGCGAGQFIRAIKRLRPDLECLGCDISNQAIELARRRNDGVVYSLSEENRLPYNDASLNAVLIFDVLEHLQNPESILNEVRRVLKPGGIFYAFVPCEGDITSLWHALDTLGLKRALTKKYAGHINYFSRRSLLRLMKENNFFIKQVRYSEHLLGQLLGVVAFHLMDKAAKKRGGEQINNEAYFEEQKKSGLIQLIKDAVNSWVYIESAVLSRVPSPNVHVVAIKDTQ